MHEPKHNHDCEYLVSFWNLQPERTKTPNDPNDENKRLNVIGEVYGLKTDYVKITDFDRFDSWDEIYYGSAQIPDFVAQPVKILGFALWKLLGSFVAYENLDTSLTHGNLGLMWDRW